MEKLELSGLGFQPFFDSWLEAGPKGMRNQMRASTTAAPKALPETFSFKPILATARISQKSGRGWRSGASLYDNPGKAQTLRRLLEEVVPPCIAYAACRHQLRLSLFPGAFLERPS